MNIENDCVIYFIEKNKGETNNTYYDRINKIIKSKPKNNKELEEIKKNIMFEINTKYLKCIY